MTDSHAHLDACDEPAAMLVERAAAAGVTPIVTIGTGIDSCRAALEIAEAHHGVFAALGIDPHQAGTGRGGAPRRASRPARAPESRRRRRDRARQRPRHAHARPSSARSSTRSSSSPTSSGCRSSSTVERPRPRRLPRWRPSWHRRPALLLLAVAAPRCARARLLRVLRRQRHLPEGAATCARPPSWSLQTGSWSRPIARISRRSPFAGARNEPAHVVHTVAALAEARGEATDELAVPYDANATRGVFACRERPAEEGARPALPRRREHPRCHRPPRGARPRPTSCSRSVPVSASSPATSRSESRFVHSVELDRSLEEPLREALRDHENVGLIFGDALALDPSSLEPPPTKLVANLPYNIATPLVVETLEHAASLERWCVMVQREVADRFFAEPRTKAYGAVSVLVQLDCAQGRLSPGFARRSSARGPGSSRPSSPSSGRRAARLVGRPRGRRSGVRASSQDARQLDRDQRARSRASEVERAVVGIGHDRRARAEELAPLDFVALAQALR